MARSAYRHDRGRVFPRRWLPAVALTMTAAWCAVLFAPAALAGPVTHLAGLPAVRMLGYAAGPKQHHGTAAGRPHYVPASATRAAPASGKVRGHRAPKPDLASPPMGTPATVRTGSARRAAGHEVTGHAIARAAAAAAAAAAGGGTDNASYSVAATFDTVAMADQNGRIAVTLTNTGTSTWGSGYALGTEVFPASDTTGTGTPLTTGANVALSGTAAPGATTIVESVTPHENPGSYAICWDMVNASGTYFSAEGGTEYCAAYTIQQYAPVINEQEPLAGTDVDSQTPSLIASATVPGGYPASPTFSYAFEILSGSNVSTATVVQSSGWVSGNGSSWTPATALAWGGTYYWRATVSDAATPPSLVGSGITWTTPISFVVGNAQPGISARLGNAYQAGDGNPIMTSDLGGSDYNGSGKTVDPHTGNVSQHVTDASVATTGPALSVVRTYNSLDPRTSQAFGAGWSSLLDMSLVPDADGTGALILTMADGQQVRFAKNAAGGYAAPQDLYAVVTALSGGGFSATDQTGTTYDLAQASGTSWLISKITDNTGKAETFGYSAGVLTTITSTTSGRALHLTWATPSGAAHPHVASVATDPVTAGQPSTALTWTYGYKGDLLTSVCPPGTSTACTAYTYITNGSHAATSVRNANPTSYYRLNDPASATAAANQVPVDDLTTLDPPATEMNTTPGATGPVSGVTATGFNGTTSWIPLDGAWCTTPGAASSCLQTADTGRVLNASGTAQSLGVSIWFRTTTASGVLIGLTSVLPPAQSCNPYCIANTATPLLWIGSNGHLQGDSATATAMSSPAAVDDGAWHQAVLIPGQAMYVDGTKVATATGSFTPPKNAYALLGTGLVTQSDFYSSWEYFNGSMADLSIYQNQLPSVGTVAAQYAAETSPAAELATISSPAGRTELSATYDTVNDRVATLTDANGGTWTYGGAIRGTSSGAYDSAVMASSPQDFWPLSDTAGPLAHDVVGGAATAARPRPPATYSNVTLGGPGPTGFPDGTAATFNGTSSQVTVPGGYFGGTGAETAELWFKTTTDGTLLSSASGQKGEPLALWIPQQGGCLEGSAGSTLLNGAFFGICASGTVNDGKWHQAVLTLSSPTTFLGTFSQTATLYLDGAELSTAQITTAATASAAGYVADIGTGPSGTQPETPDGYFGGSIADVSFYSGGLTSSQVAAHYSALQDQVTPPSGVPTFPTGPTSTVTLPTLNTQTIAVTSPSGKNAAYLYDSSGSLVKETGVLGGTTYFGYDEARRASTITDPDGNTTYMSYDAHNNVTSTTTCASVSNCQTSYTSYDEDLSNPVDPRNDKPTDARDARSSSPTDPTYDTVTTYTPSAQLASRTTPATTACPSGCTTAYAYTAGTEAATGGGTEPAGLLASVTATGGGTTTFAYDSAGDVMQTTDPLGMVTKYTYDKLGRELTQTQVSSTYPAGLTTSYTYDGQDRILTETDPPVTDRVTGAVHTQVITYTYDADGNVLTKTLRDATGGDPPRTITSTYNAHGEQASTTSALGYTTSYTYDALGDRVAETNPAGVTTAYGYDAAGNLLITTLEGYTGNPGNPVPAENLVAESRAYDPAGRLASVTNVVGTQTDYTYYGNGQVASSWVVDPGSSTGTEDVTTYGYDAAGNVITETRPGGLVTDTAYNADDQVTSRAEDPSGADIITTPGYGRDGNVISESQAGGGVTQTETMTYNAADEELSQTVDNTGGNLTTTWARDQRGLVTSQTDPDGHVTYSANDEAGRTVVETHPAMAAQDGTGSAPVTAAPVTMTGYDTFGDQVESSDADGNVTTAAFDAGGQETSVTDPSYTPPGSSTPVRGVTTMAYNHVGEETSTTDPVGNTTTMSYDQLGDMTSKTDPGGGTWTYTYDPAGEQTSVTDPTGAQTQATYDNLGELVTTTDLVRQNASAAYTTTYGYDAAGNLTAQTSPTGVKDTAAYNALGKQTSSTDGAGNITTYAYDLDGNPTKTTLPDGTATTTSYDLAGRPVSQSDLSSAGTTLRTESAAYDGDGDVTAQTDFRGDTATATYNADGLQTAQAQPVSASKSITVSFGYDLDGNQTALTHGNGNTTYTTYNSLGLAQASTEPPTATHSTAADSVTTDSYDGNGDLVTQRLPGGGQVTSSYDANGDLTGQSGSGATAPTATRTFTYDGDGRTLTAATGAAGTASTFGYQAPTSESFSYDDRGLLLAAAGSAGASSLTYNGSGQQTSATDAGGTSTYTYNSAGLLATDANAASGATGTYSYNNLDRVTQISYGSGHDIQAFGYDSLHRVTSDTISTSSGTQVASIGYGYDANDNVTSMTTSGLATSGGGTGTVTNTYGYDEANRLTSWTATPAGGSLATATYGYDNDGNLTTDNGVTSTYDARDELTSDGKGNTYAYTADGDLVTQNGSGSATYASTSDAYGQQITNGSASSFTWDALDRVTSVGAQNNASYHIALTYDGDTSDVASDSSATYSRDPAGQITGVDASSGGKMIALNDQHDDLSGMFTAAGTALATATTYDPWGAVLATTGPSVQVGYQGQWTDPATQQVAMGSRFYRPGTAGFGNSDTRPDESGVAVTDNLHAYADDNPMTVTDPTGHSPSGKGSSRGPTAADVAAAGARAAEASAKAAAADAAYYSARAVAAAVEAAAHSAAALARELNSAAVKLAAQAAATAQQAAAAFRAAQAELRVAESWQDLADQAWSAAGQDVAKAARAPWYEPWKAAQDLWDAARYAAEAAADEVHAALAMADYALLGAKALGLEILADTEHLLAAAAALVAKGAAEAAEALADAADTAERDAEALGAIAARAMAVAEHDSAVFAALSAAYAAELARKAAAIAKAAAKKVAKAAKTVAKTVAKAAVTVAKTAYKVSGAQAVVSCVTDPHLSSCLQAAATVAAIVVTTVATGGAGDIAIGAAEVATEDAAEDVGAGAAEDAAKDAGEGAGDPPCEGGESFTAGTKVLLASGVAIPISQLKVGDKVLATNTKTGKTQAEPISAVMVKRDTDRYDLQMKTARGTAVIHTTSKHLFWAATQDRWVKAAALRYGSHLRTPAGSLVTVAGGYAPVRHIGRMWDLSVPGDNDHDFYIDTTVGSVLVHNCPMMKGKSNVANATDYTVRQIGRAIEAVKQGAPWRAVGSLRNPDVWIDSDTGEVYPPLPGGGPADDSIGNIFDHLPEK